MFSFQRGISALARVRSTGFSRPFRLKAVLRTHQSTTGQVLALVVTLLVCSTVSAADQPQWGQAWSRNMVSSEKDLPVTFEPGVRNKEGNIDLPAGSGVKWVVRLGDASYGSPVVADGRVYVGTNNNCPRDPRLPGDRGVLMCLEEKTGKLLWQLCLPKLTRIKWSDWYNIGLTSPPTIEGDRAYVVSNRGEVMCLDVQGMANGNQGPCTDEERLMTDEGQPPVKVAPQDADVLWLYDMPGELKVTPHNGSNCSVLAHGNFLYVCTSQGVDWTHDHVAHPEAPSVVVLDKRTGKLVARDDFRIGLDITHGSWSSLAMDTVNGKPLMVFGGGNGVLYGLAALDPAKLSGEAKLPLLLPAEWRFQGHPLAQTQAPPKPDHQHDSTSYEVTSVPVIYKNRAYVTFSQEAYHNMKLGYVGCVDTTKSGDITRGGLVWAYDKTGSGVSTVAIADGLVYAADFAGRLHCLDADTGHCYWVHDAGGPVWGSPLLADGKIYLGSGGKQTLWVLAPGKEVKVLGRIRMRDGIFATPTAANGTLYVMTNKHLYAVGK